MGSGARKRKQVWAIWERQGGKCYWCAREIFLRFRSGGGAAFPDEATLDHLDDKFSEERGQHPTEFRRVVACNDCNERRGREAQERAGIDELRRRSGRGNIDA